MSVYQYVRNQTAGDPYAKAVLIAAAHYADWQYGHCFPSAQTLGRDCECSERTVRAKLDVLAERGLIRLEPRPGKTPIIIIVGYREWFLENEKRARKTPEASSGVGRQTPERGAQTPERHAATPEAGSDELSLTATLTDIKSPLTTPLPPSPAAPATRLNNLDEWEQAPPTPAPKVVSNRSIENPSRPESSQDQGARGEVGEDRAAQAREVARRAAAETISTNDWARVWAEYHPEGHKAWTEWMQANGYEAQVIASRGRGYIFVPAAEFTPEGAELFSRKFPLASRAKMGNAASPAKWETRV